MSTERRTPIATDGLALRSSERVLRNQRDTNDLGNAVIKIFSVDRMRILHVIGSVDPASGGPIEGVLRQEEVTRGIDNLAVREIVSLDPPESAFLSEFPVEVSAVGRTKKTGLAGPVRRILDHYRYSPRLIPWLRANVARFDVVLVHGLWNYSAFAASKVLPNSGIPYFVFTHGMMDPWFRQAYPLKHRGKQLSWIMAEGRLLARANSVLFTCEEERRLARSSFQGPYRETVVGYGAAEPPPASPDDADILSQAVPGLKDSRFILFLSRIHEKKGCDDLLTGFAKAVAMDPQVRLVIAGPDTTQMQPVLQQHAVALGIGDRVLWPGPIYGDAKWAALRLAEAFALPSHQENFGIAVAEALGCGTPVLISNQVNIWREIADAGAGYVDDDNPAGVERQIRRWFGTTPDDRRAMGDAARSLFQDRFCVVNTAPELLRTMSQCAGLEFTNHNSG